MRKERIERRYGEFGVYRGDDLVAIHLGWIENRWKDGYLYWTAIHVDHVIQVRPTYGSSTAFPWV